MKSLYEYLAETEKTFEYKVKTLWPLDDEKMSLLERVFSRYDIVSLDGPYESVTELNPLDFKNVKYATVFIVNVTTKMPLSPYYTMQKLRSVFEIPEGQIVVRGSNEPIEQETIEMQDKREFDQMAIDNDLVRSPLMSTSPIYQEHDYNSEEVPYGDEFNKKFLKKLANEDDAKPEKYGILKWLEKKDDAYFNKGIDCVNPIYDNGDKEEPDHTGMRGEYRQADKERTRLYMDKNGKKVLAISNKGKNNIS